MHTQDLSSAALSVLPASLALVGAGKMGGAMLEGWLETGLDATRIQVIDPYLSSDMRQLCEARGVRHTPELEEANPVEALVLAIKPQMLDEAGASLSRLISSETVVLSILAGKTIANLMSRLASARAIVRAMPNLPASVRRGVTAAVASDTASRHQRDMAHTLLAGVGKVEWLEDESLMDAVTAVSGSGPAYVFHLVECLAQAGEAAGLPAGLAERLARETVVGAGELLHSSPLPAQDLRQNVTSPGGTTAAALTVLMNSKEGLSRLIQRTVTAAKTRSESLSG